MYINSKKERKHFNFTYHGLTLEFELFSKSFILKKLKELEDKKMIPPIKCIRIPKSCPFKKLKQYYENEQINKRYFFAYIKFFEYEGEEYGLVGGKTNYGSPDINFDKNSDTIARIFLREEKCDWSREVIIVHHIEENITDRIKADKQAKFLELFLQRTFHLFDS